MGTITRRTDNAGKATYQVKIRRKGQPGSLGRRFIGVFQASLSQR